MSKIDVIVATTGRRQVLLQQTLESIYVNAADHDALTLTLVVDGAAYWVECGRLANLMLRSKAIMNYANVGASAARNIGASSIPKYRRGSHVCFFDDDIYAVKAWDAALMTLSNNMPDAIVSGHSHPYNGFEVTVSGVRSIDSDGKVIEHTPGYGRPLVISTVNMLMPWSLWDDVGFFQEPGGAGGSEDYDFCMRAKAKGYGFAVTEPQVIIHTGLTSTTGKQIVGYDEMVKQNERLIKQHGLKGVIWQ